jgi:hypothetical protein
MGLKECFVSHIDTHKTWFFLAQIRSAETCYLNVDDVSANLRK